MIDLIILKKRIGPVLGRHPWVFSGAIKNIPDGIKSGEPVRLFSEDGRFLSAGYFNSYSQIAVRVWSWNETEKVDEIFFENRIKQANELRAKLVLNKKTDSCRLINSESDLLPGLIVDKYGDYLSVQFHNKGIEKYKKEIIESLVKIIKPKGIYERSDVGNRAKEAFSNLVLSSTDAKQDLKEDLVGVLYGKVPASVNILENGYKFLIDIKTGQKTGFFLDQRDKRLALQKYCEGKKVLNCFSYTGGFSVYAAAAGAKKTASVDVSQPALDLARENFKLNKLNFKNASFACEDVKKFLADLEPGKSEYDVIILDPPAFIKDRHKIKEGIIGYKKINELAMRLLPPGGILVTCSCSQHLSLVDFRHLISESAGRAGRTVQILETYTHGIDHPQLVAFTEGEYLKCVFALVI